ncbi:hypothetical protein Hanom_Chr01g00055321 [Helianthus anomalus]
MFLCNKRKKLKTPISCLTNTKVDILASKVMPNDPGLLILGMIGKVTRHHDHNILFFHTTFSQDLICMAYICL